VVGNAGRGKVIQAFRLRLVIGGNYVVGLVVFAILMIIKLRCGDKGVWAWAYFRVCERSLHPDADCPA